MDVNGIRRTTQVGRARCDQPTGGVVVVVVAVGVVVGVVAVGVCVGGWRGRARVTVGVRFDVAVGVTVDRGRTDGRFWSKWTASASRDRARRRSR